MGQGLGAGVSLTLDDNTITAGAYVGLGVLGVSVAHEIDVTPTTYGIDEFASFAAGTINDPSNYSVLGVFDDIQNAPSYNPADFQSPPTQAEIEANPSLDPTYAAVLGVVETPTTPKGTSWTPVKKPPPPLHDLATVDQFGTPLSGAHCFPAGTNIKIANGDYLPIEHITLGRSVVSFAHDGGTNAPLTSSTVTRLYENIADEFIELAYFDPTRGETRHITSTPGHVYQTAMGGWSRLCDMLETKTSYDRVVRGGDGETSEVVLSRHSFAVCSIQRPIFNPHPVSNAHPIAA